MHGAEGTGVDASFVVAHFLGEFALRNSSSARLKSASQRNRRTGFRRDRSSRASDPAAARRRQAWSLNRPPSCNPQARAGIAGRRFFDRPFPNKCPAANTGGPTLFFLSSVVSRRSGNRLLLADDGIGVCRKCAAIRTTSLLRTQPVACFHTGTRVAPFVADLYPLPVDVDDHGRPADLDLVKRLGFFTDRFKIFDDPQGVGFRHDLALLVDLGVIGAGVTRRQKTPSKRRTDSVQLFCRPWSVPFIQVVGSVGTRTVLVQMFSAQNTHRSAHFQQE